MPTTRDMYFDMLIFIFDGMTKFSDKKTADIFGRLKTTFELLSLRKGGTEDLAYDRHGTGLPILKEILEVSKDVKQKYYFDIPSQEIKKRMIDHILTRRRRPDDAMFEKMHKAVYSETIESNHLRWFEPTTEKVSWEHGTEGSDGIEVEWDHWDGATITPIHVECDFVPTSEEIAGDRLENEMKELSSISRTMSGKGFKPISLATEIDERIRSLRLKKFRRLLMGPFRSSIFTEAEDDFTRFLQSMTDIENAWTFSWIEEELRSVSTIMKTEGIMRKKRIYEVYYIDRFDPEKIDRGVSDFQIHTVMPSKVYQIMADTEAGKKILERRRIHILSETELTEDV